MELQFEKTVINRLCTLMRQAQNQELTQDIKLSEGSPDIGRILGAWGQVLIHGKEWRNGYVSASGEVAAWVLYMPEDGDGPCCVHCDLPFQMKWDIPETKHDGAILLQPVLRNVDARSVGPRKMVVRADLNVMAEAAILGETTVYAPTEMLEDVQLLRRSHAVMIPKEAGEKAFSIDDDLALPASAPQFGTIAYYHLKPELIDRKVLADKVVFRGAALLHLLYRGVDGKLHTWDFEVPFSQYAQMQQECSENGTVRLLPIVTELELTPKEDGGFHFKAGLAAQYTVYEGTSIELVEDAYCPGRQVNVMTGQLDLPTLHRTELETYPAEEKTNLDATGIVDVTFHPQMPRVVKGDSYHAANMSGQFQVLYYDGDGELQNFIVDWEKSQPVEAGGDDDVQLAAWISGKPQALFSNEGVDLQADILADTGVMSNLQVPMVTGLELGEKKQPEMDAPSLILRRTEGEELWQIAKETGSTVEKIRKANGLEQEPPIGKMLIIPLS